MNPDTIEDLQYAAFLAALIFVGCLFILAVMCGVLIKSLRRHKHGTNPEDALPED